MRILTEEESRETLQGKTVGAFAAQLADRLQLVEGTYSTPVNSGTQIALSRLFAYLVLGDAPVCLHISGWSIALSTENLDLFYGYRRSIGEGRPLIEAPVHLFERADDGAFISLLCMVLFFSWDASVFDLTGRWLLRTSHDGWLEVRAANEVATKDVAAELKSYRMSLRNR